MFYHKSYQLIVDEHDVMYVLKVINRHQGVFSNVDKRIGNCGWANEPTKWYIQFHASDKEWNHIVAELSRTGVIKANATPGGKVILRFEGAS